MPQVSEIAETGWVRVEARLIVYQRADTGIA